MAGPPHDAGQIRLGAGPCLGSDSLPPSAAIQVFILVVDMTTAGLAFLMQSMCHGREDLDLERLSICVPYTWGDRPDFLTTGR